MKTILIAVLVIALGLSAAASVTSLAEAAYLIATGKGFEDGDDE